MTTAAHPRTRVRHTPWRDGPAHPGPVIVFDIDGVVATMTKFEHLLSGGFSIEQWKQFQTKFPYAAPIAQGARLADSAVQAGFQIVWSTTRPDAAAADTWKWLIRHNLPLGPIMTRRPDMDAQRPAVEVKLRHWYSWLDRHPDNPIVAWVDDDDSALAALRYNGCATWHPTHLRRTIVRHKDAPLMATLMQQAVAAGVLADNLRTHRPEWEAREGQWLEQMSKVRARKRSRRQTRCAR